MSNIFSTTAVSRLAIRTCSDETFSEKPPINRCSPCSLLAATSKSCIKYTVHLSRWGREGKGMTKQRWHILTCVHGLVRNIAVTHTSLSSPFRGKQSRGRAACACYSPNFFFRQLNTRDWWSRIRYIEWRIQNKNFCTLKYAFCRKR